MDDVLAIGSKITKSSRRSAEPKQTPLPQNDDLEESDAPAIVPAEICVSRSSSDICNELQEENKSSSYQIGERVEAKYRGKGRRFYPGTIKLVLEGDRYDIDYDDGDRDKALLAEFIRRPMSNQSSSDDTQVQEDRKAVVAKEINLDADESGVSITFAVGQKVEARYRGRGRR